MTSPTSPRTPLSLKAKLLLVLFGTGCALVMSIVVLQFAPTSSKGTEFNSIDDVRKAMMRDDEPAELKGQNGSGPISLRAIVRPHPSDSLIYTLKPNLDLNFVRAHVQTNTCGLRSPERPVAKEKGVYRIALLGDSFAFGWGVEQPETFAQIMENELNRLSHGSPRIEVINLGVPGYSTFQEVALLEEVGLDFDPDAVLVYFVQNDFGMPFFIRDIAGGGGILSSLKFVQLSKQLLSPEDANKQIEALGLDPNHALKRLAAITSERGIRTYLTINPRKSWRSDLSRLWALKKDSPISFIPLRESLMEYITRNQIKEEDLTLSFDPHPSPIRHKLLGELLAASFMEVLPQ